MFRVAIITLFAAAFAGIALFGILLMPEHADMGGCPLMAGYDSLCAVPAMGHIEAWQSTFVATAAQVFALLAVAFIAIAAIVSASFRTPFFFVRGAPGVPASHDVSVSFLARAFARGVVHPQLYA